MGYELEKVESDMYRIIEDGEVIDEVSEREACAIYFRHDRPGIDTGGVEIAIALAAISGFVVGSDMTVGFRALGIISFYLSTVGAYLLLGAYVLPRAPLAFREAHAALQGRSPLLLSAHMILSWPYRAVRFMLGVYDDAGDRYQFSVEAGYFAVLYSATLLLVVSSFALA